MKEIKFDKQTLLWLNQHNGLHTTLCKCNKCNLFYKASLNHKCNKEK